MMRGNLHHRSSVRECWCVIYKGGDKYYIYYSNSPWFCGGRLREKNISSADGYELAANSSIGW